MAGEAVDSEEERQWLAGAGERERIAYVRTERWITYPRAAAILDQMQLLLDHPRNSRMPSLLIVGESGIGKTQLDLKFCRDHPPQFDERNLRTISPVVSLQMPAAATDRLFYMTLLRAVGAVFSPRITTAEAMIMVLRLYADLSVRMVIFDETHNMLSGTYSDQRRLLTQLRYLSNELRVSLVCLGIDTAGDAIAGDPQLARRFGQVELPAWQVDADFRALIATFSAIFHCATRRYSIARPCKRSSGRHAATPPEYSSCSEISQSRRSGTARNGSRRTQSALGGRRSMTGPQRDETAMDSATAAGPSARDPVGRKRRGSVVMADPIGRTLSRSSRDVARTARHLRECPHRPRPVGTSDGPGAAVHRHAFVAGSDPAHDFYRRIAGSARVRGASLAALDLPTVCIGVHRPGSCPGPAAHLVHRRCIAVPALPRTAQPIPSPDQPSAPQYHRRRRAL